MDPDLEAYRRTLQALNEVWCARNSNGSAEADALLEEATALLRRAADLLEPQDDCPI